MKIKTVGESIYKSWPMPFPMLFDSFASYSYEPVAAMFMPAKLSILQVAMNSVFRTVRGRGPNTLSATGSLTGGGKDGNTLEPISIILIDIENELGNDGKERKYQAILNAFKPTAADVTGITQYLEAINETHASKGGVVIIDAEGERFFVNVGQRGDGAAGYARAIAAAEVEAYNGFKISGRITGKADQPDILNPNVSPYRLVQTDLLHKSITPWLIDKGYVPRLDVFYDDDDRVETPSTLLNGHIPDPHEDYIPFTIYAGEWFFKKFDNKDKITVVSGQEGGHISNYEINTLYKRKDELSDIQWRSIKRISITGEKYVTTIAPWVWCWKDYCREVKKDGSEEYNPIEDIKVVDKGKEITIQGISGAPYEECIIPILEMLVENKLYLLDKSDSNKESEIYDLLDGVYSRCLDSKAKEFEAFTSVGLVPRPLLNKVAGKNKGLGLVDIKQDLGTNWDRKVAEWIRDNKYDIIHLEIGGVTRPCIVPRKDADEIMKQWETGSL